MGNFNNEMVKNEYKDEKIFDEMITKKKEVRETKSIKMYIDDWSVAYQIKAKTGKNLVDIVSEAMESLKEKYNL
ncbi:hypothetical protein TP70_01275 [Staphylococcus microti]|uniref:Uncharacterized protein n=1 Tax=Staphylococcus microti TaxID=569857 RepID=A0A0D6XUX1_9STAP|nr:MULTISPECIES: hypothetical protein [Staphylococcus]KIR10385.1 hypothetical protein SH09_13490 [Staphylococcus gallinarum]KIX91648.1 hypothetical protein TP70_01275 [Staphylococcus microti]PNZ84133.1 hypothetical protein CD132_01145 [Staphylococcus microti]SUN02200.1 Uncharacterised protein [Staphylococcus microti]